jgi:hypothetical protein
VHDDISCEFGMLDALSTVPIVATMYLLRHAIVIWLKSLERLHSAIA